MTKTTMDVSELLQRHDQGDFLRAVAEAVLQLIMETDVEGVIGAGKHERADGRTTWRNGYRERSLDTRSGHAEPEGAKAAPGQLFPWLPGTPKNIGEGLGRCHPESLDRRRIHAPGR